MSRTLSSLSKVIYLEQGSMRWFVISSRIKAVIGGISIPRRLLYQKTKARKMRTRILSSTTSPFRVMIVMSKSRMGLKRNFSHTPSVKSVSIAIKWYLNTYWLINWHLWWFYSAIRTLSRLENNIPGLTDAMLSMLGRSVSMSSIKSVIAVTSSTKKSKDWSICRLNSLNSQEFKLLKIIKT